MDLEGAPRISVGSHHAETPQPTLANCHQTLLNAAAVAESSTVREHVEALLTMLPDMHEQPKKPRLRELATLLGVAKKKQGKNLPMDQLFRNVQKAFFACVSDPSACGDAHPAAHSGTGAVPNESEHLGGAALPAFDVQILQAVQTLGHYPKEIKKPSSDADQREPSWQS